MIREIDQKLYKACIKEPADLNNIEDLLKAGADPMGSIIDDYKDKNILYPALVNEYVGGRDDSPKDFYDITALFLQYGMDIEKPGTDYENPDSYGPMWYFGFYSGENTIKILNLLLKHGLSAEAAGQAWGHAISDYFDVWGKLEDDFSYEMLYYTIKTIMLIASYPHVLNADKQLQDLIWFSNNTYDVKKFRNWNGYDFDVDTGKCSRGFPEVYRSIVSIKEKASGLPVWKMGLGISPDEANE